MDAREQRGLMIAAKCRIKRCDDGWIVPSQSTPGGKYKVYHSHDSYHCTCPDHEVIGCVCKHIHAVKITIEREENEDGSVTETVTMTETITQYTLLQPDLRRLRVPPLHKFGSVARWPQWAQDIAPELGRWITQNLWDKQASSYPPNLLERMLETNPACAAAMGRFCLQYPLLKQAFDRFHGRGKLAACLSKLREKLASSPVLEPPVNAGGFIHALDGLVVKQASSAEKSKGKVPRILVDEDEVITHNLPPLADPEKATLRQNGYLVRDIRKGEEVSKAYNTEVMLTLVNPRESGLYELLIKPASFERSLIIANPAHNAGRLEGALCVRLETEEGFRPNLNVHPTALWVKQNTESREDFAKWFDGLPDRKSLKEDGRYMLVDVKGGGTCAFTVEQKLEEDEYVVHFDRCLDHDRPGMLPAIAERGRHIGHMSRYDGPPADSNYNSGEQLLVFNMEQSAKFRSLQNTLYAPDTCKVLQLEPVPEKDKDGYRRSNYEKKRKLQNEYLPGTQVDLELAIMEKTAGSLLRIYSDGNEAALNNQSLRSKQAVLFSLIRDHGFRDYTARELMKQADAANAAGKKFQCYVKYAYGYPYAETVGRGPDAPAIPEEMEGADPTSGYTRALFPEQHQLPVPELDSSQTDTSIWDMRPEALPDPMLMQQAQQAADTGQKEVFDLSMLQGLIKQVGRNNLFDSELNDLFETLSRLGRMRFLFYWHNDDFEDRYGKAELPELEDSLQNNFEGLGDLVLWLNEKTVSFKGGGQPTLSDVAGN